jgi:hypothetical protein
MRKTNNSVTGTHRSNPFPARADDPRREQDKGLEK